MVNSSKTDIVKTQKVLFRNGNSKTFTEIVSWNKERQDDSTASAEMIFLTANQIVHANLWRYETESGGYIVWAIIKQMRYPFV